jgi:two-component system chemotaxis response regulator CheB
MPGLRNGNSTVVAIGGSAGSIRILMRILSMLPHDFKGILLIAVHRAYGQKSHLAELLRGVTHLKIVEIVDSERLTSAAVYLSEPARHLAVRKDGYHALLLPDPFGLRRTQSIDELFTSVAAAAGVHSVGVLLSGMMSDGVAGLKAIERAGGVTIVQDPADAQWPDMPRNALRSVAVDYVLDHRHIAPVLVEISKDRGLRIRPERTDGEPADADAGPRR